MYMRQRKNIIIVSLMIILVGMTIGYSVLSSYLTINGTSNITSDFKVVFTNIQEGTMNSATTVNKSFTGTSATFQVKLDKPGSNAEYIVTVQNQGKLDAYLESIEGINEANNKTPNEIKFSLEGITVGDSLNVGETKIFKVKVIYNELATTIPSTSKTLTLKLNYKQKTIIDIENPVNTLLAKTNDLLESSEAIYNYMDGIYLAGAQDSNYVWFDGFLWRIMGVNADGSIRMITEENLTAIPWGAVNTAEDYDNSYVNDWLNNYFYPKLKNKEYLVKQTWCSETTEDSNSMRTTCTNNLSQIPQYVGLLSLDESNLSNIYNGYLKNSQYFWTITPYNVSNVWRLINYGESGNMFGTFANGIRPVINVFSNIIITGGNGTLNNPYMFKNQSSDVIGSLKDNSQIGEYVTYAGRNYRVVETGATGTKLILDGYYDSNNDGIIEESDKMEYGENCTLCVIINKDNFINWLSNNREIEKNKLSSTIWYRSDGFYEGQNYKLIIDSFGNPYEGKVGLIRVGEILSAQSETILSKNHTVYKNNDLAQWYFTGVKGDNNESWYLTSLGYSYIGSNSLTFSIRPVINIDPTVQIIGGNGTFNSPYQI